MLPKYLSEVTFSIKVKVQPSISTANFMQFKNEICGLIREVDEKARNLVFATLKRS